MGNLLGTPRQPTICTPFLCFWTNIHTIGSIDVLLQDFAATTDRWERLASLMPDRLMAAAKVYSTSLEKLPIQYHEQQLTIIEGQNLFDIFSQVMQQRVQALLYLRGETLVGALHFASSALKEICHRLENARNDVDLDAAIKTFSNLHEQHLQRLAIISSALQHMAVDNTACASVLLQPSRRFSVRDFKGPAFYSFIRDSLRMPKDGLVTNLPDIMFSLLVCIIVISIFRILSLLTRRATGTACGRAGANLSLLPRNTLASVLSGKMMVAGLLMALSQIGTSLGPMLVGLGTSGFCSRRHAARYAE